jgi:hypothetical protein
MMEENVIAAYPPGGTMSRFLALRSAGVIGTVIALAAIVGAGTKWW